MIPAVIVAVVSSVMTIASEQAVDKSPRRSDVSTTLSILPRFNFPSSSITPPKSSVLPYAA